MSAAPRSGRGIFLTGQATPWWWCPWRGSQRSICRCGEASCPSGPARAASPRELHAEVVGTRGVGAAPRAVALGLVPNQTAAVQGDRVRVASPARRAALAGLVVKRTVLPASEQDDDDGSTSSMESEAVIRRERGGPLICSPRARCTVVAPAKLEESAPVHFGHGVWRATRLGGTHPADDARMMTECARSEYSRKQQASGERCGGAV